MAWVLLDDEELNRMFAAPELEAARTLVLEDGQEDPVPEILTATIDEARGRISACKDNTLGPAGTLPSAVIHHVLAMVRFRVWNRLGLDLSDSRTKEFQSAETFFRDVANCKVNIERPAAAADSKEQNQSGSFEKVSGRDREATRKKMDGLL